MKDIVDTVEMPDQDGKSPGDLWYGLPIIPTLATHIWNGRSWRPLLTEEGYYKAEITALRAENERLKTSGIAEVAAHNPSVMDYMRHWEGRAGKAEAENEKLRAALREYECHCPTSVCEWFPCGRTARTALEERP